MVHAEGAAQREGSPPKKKVKVVESVRPEIDKVPKRLVSGRSRSPMRERKKSETEVEIEVDGMKELHVTLSPRTPAGDPPEPEELIKALLVSSFQLGVNYSFSCPFNFFAYSHD
jgi:regulator of Ty1 transposition protein 103